MSTQAKRRWYQFSLRRLIVLVTVAGFGLGYVAYERQTAQQHQEIKAALANQNIRVLGFKSPRPGWLKKILGDDTASQAKTVVIRASMPAHSPDVLAAAASQIKRLPSVNAVIFERTQLDDAGLRHFRQLNHLQYVWLNESKISDQGLNELLEFKSLKQLNVMSCPISDKGLQAICRHPEIETLGLGGTGITDKGIHELRQLSNLKWLNLANTSVTDRSLKEFQNLPALEELVLTGTQVTASGVQKLQQVLPKVRICHESLPQNKASPIY